MQDAPEPDRSRAAPHREPVRRSLRIACGLLGAALLGLAAFAAFGEPNPWLSLPPMAIGAWLLLPALATGAPPADPDEAERALARALELAAAARALLAPGLFGLIAARVIEGSRPGFVVADDAVGAVATALVAALLLAGVGCAVAAVYWRARALGR